MAELFSTKGSFGGSIRVADGAPGFVDVLIVDNSGVHPVSLSIAQAGELSAALTKTAPGPAVAPDGLRKPGVAT